MHGLIIQNIIYGYQLLNIEKKGHGGYIPSSSPHVDHHWPRAVINRNGCVEF